MPSPPNIPQGGTPSERLDMAFRKVLMVSKEEIVARERSEKPNRHKQPEKSNSVEVTLNP